VIDVIGSYSEQQAPDSGGDWRLVLTSGLPRGVIFTDLERFRGSRWPLFLL